MKKARFFKIDLGDEVFALFDTEENTLSICRSMPDGSIKPLINVKTYVSLDDLELAPATIIQALNDVDEGLISGHRTPHP